MYTPYAPSKEQQNALRLVLMYFEDHVLSSKGNTAEIHGFVDNIIDKYEPADFVRTKPGEACKAVSYTRANASEDTLRKNYPLFLYGLRVWLRWRRLRHRALVVPALLEPAFQILGLREPDHFIDRAFVESCYRRRGGDPYAIAQRVVEEHQGFWLVYRLSTPRKAPMAKSAEGPIVANDETLINVSLLRVLSYPYLRATDRLSPRFTFEFRSEDGGTAVRPNRVEGYLVPLGERLYLIGRRYSHANPTLSSFSWPMPDIVLREPARHPNMIESLAYGTNSENEQVAFYFVAKFIHESANYSLRAAFVAARNVYEGLTGVYAFGKLNEKVIEAYKEARQAVKAVYEEGGLGHALPEERSPILDRREFERLFEQSRDDVVFKRR